MGEGHRVAVMLTDVAPRFAETLVAGGEALTRLARIGSVTLDGRPHGIGAHAVLQNGTEVFVPA